MKKVAFRLFVMLLLAGVVVGAYALWPRDSTAYARAFDRSRFARLQLGTSEANLEKTLGSPLHVRTLSLRERWSYCLGTPSSSGAEVRGLFYRSDIPLSDCPAVEFGLDGNVADVEGLPESLLGLKAETVAGRLGRPVQIRRSGTFTIWYYSGPTHQQASYQQYTVTLDEQGRVIGKDLLRLGD